MTPASAFYGLIALFPGILEAVTYEKTAVPTVELGYCTAIAPIANHGSHEQSIVTGSTSERWPGARSPPLGMRIIELMLTPGTAVHSSSPMVQKCLSSTRSNCSTLCLDGIFSWALDQWHLTTAAWLLLCRCHAAIVKAPHIFNGALFMPE